MIVNSKISKNQKQFWEGSEIYFLIYSLLFYYIYYMRKNPIHVAAQVKHQIHYASLEVSKKFMTNSLQQ